MDPIKEAFLKIKRDINYLFSRIESLEKDIREIKRALCPAENSYNFAKIRDSTDKPTDRQTNKEENLILEGLKTQNFNISTGNKGVPTDKPTDRQTNQQTDILTKDRGKDPISEFKKANEILRNLDEIKRKIRQKFKSLTPQEMKVFSTIYTLEEVGKEDITYRDISKALNLTESSIRDYVNKIIKKGISIEKYKVKNKQIVLKISQNIKNIATLETIQRLRDL